MKHYNLFSVIPYGTERITINPSIVLDTIIYGWICISGINSLYICMSGMYKAVMRMEENRYPNQDLYSNAVRAGKRTYFFDVKSTRDGEYYLIVTESKKVTRPNGDFNFEKHKIFLYKEDFEKFNLGLSDALKFIEVNNGGNAGASSEWNEKSAIPDFEDLA